MAVAKKWKFTAVAAALVVTSGLSVQAQEEEQRESKPFFLGAERRHVVEDEEQPPARNPNRLQRGQVSDEMPPVAPSPSLRSQVGVSDKGGFNLRAEDWALPANVGKRKPLQGQVAMKLLSDYDVELIVDESMSMRKRDCPGRTSRWDWCGMQLQDLSSRLEPLVPRGLTLTTFNSFFNVYANASPRDVSSLFNNPDFFIGTKLSKPLGDRLGAYFAKRRPGTKPLLVVVITDGAPSGKREPWMVAQTLVEASRRMTNPREVTIVFFQIGSTDQYGRDFLAYLDHELVREGARYDFIRTVPFEALESEGLTTALVETIRNAPR